MGFLIALLFLWIPCAIFCGTISEDKGHNGIAWFWGGLLFGPIAMLAVAALGDRKLRRYIRLMAENQGVTSPMTANRKGRLMLPTTSSKTSGATEVTAARGLGTCRSHH